MPSPKTKLPGKRGRKPALRAAVDLPCPPLRNDSLAFSRWHDVASSRLNSDAVPGMEGPVHLALRAGLSTEPRDLTGVVASVIGLLSERRVIEGAERITDQLVKWDRTIEPGTIRLELRQTREPSERIGSDTRAKVSANARARFAEARP